MSEMVSANERKRRMSIMEDDIRTGKIRRDTLVNSAFKFEGETRAMYYSNARKNMQTYVAGEVMRSNQQLDDLDIIALMKKENA